MFESVPWASTEHAMDNPPTPQEIQRRTGLTQKQTIKAIDNNEIWAFPYGVAGEVNWDDWDVPGADREAKLRELIGDDWKAKWDKP
jgi:hypothetical protein